MLQLQHPAHPAPRQTPKIRRKGSLPDTEGADVVPDEGGAGWLTLVLLPGHCPSDSQPWQPSSCPLLLSVQPASPLFSSLGEAHVHLALLSLGSMLTSPSASLAWDQKALKAWTLPVSPSKRTTDSNSRTGHIDSPIYYTHEKQVPGEERACPASQGARGQPP